MEVGVGVGHGDLGRDVRRRAHGASTDGASWRRVWRGGWGPPGRGGGFARPGERLVPRYEAWALDLGAGGGRHRWVALAPLPQRVHTLHGGPLPPRLAGGLRHVFTLSAYHGANLDKHADMYCTRDFRYYIVVNLLVVKDTADRLKDIVGSATECSA